MKKKLYDIYDPVQHNILSWMIDLLMNQAAVWSVFWLPKLSQVSEICTRGIGVSVFPRELSSTHFLASNSHCIVLWVNWKRLHAFPSPINPACCRTMNKHAPAIFSLTLAFVTESFKNFVSAFPPVKCKCIWMAAEYLGVMFDSHILVFHTEINGKRNLEG